MSPSESKKKCMLISSSIRNGVGACLHRIRNKFDSYKKKKTKEENNEHLEAPTEKGQCWSFIWSVVISAHFELSIMDKFSIVLLQVSKQSDIGQVKPDCPLPQNVQPTKPLATTWVCWAHYQVAQATPSRSASKHTSIWANFRN